MMEQRHRDLLEAKRLEISSDLRFRDIRRHLLDNGILNGRDLDDIESEEKRGDQVKALLDILPDRGPKAFNVFRDALKHRYPHLARILNDDGQEEEAKQNETRVFIIHAGEDKDSFVRPLVSTLRQQGLAEKDIFFDDVSIRPGEVIRDRIISTLSSQNLELAVIVVSTSLLNKPYWPKLEIETCLKNKIPTFPIWVDANTDNFKAFSDRVGNYSPTLKQLSARRVQRDDVTDELPKVAAEVVQRVSTLKCTQPGPTEQAVKEFQRLSIALASSPVLGTEEFKQYLLAMEARHKQDLIAMEERYIQASLAMEEKYRQALQVRENRQKEGSTGEDHRQDSSLTPPSQSNHGSGKANAAHARPPSPWKEDVNCNSRIAHEDISDFLYGHRERLTDTDRKLLQEARTLVIEESNWIWEHAQITVYGKHMTAVFYSGERTNKYVVQLDSQGRPTRAVEERGWILAGRDTAKSGLDGDTVRNTSSAALNGVAGTALVRVTSGLLGFGRLGWW